MALALRLLLLVPALGVFSFNDHGEKVCHLLVVHAVLVASSTALSASDTIMDE